MNAPGVIVTPGTPDPQNPNALPLLGFIQSPYTNANSYMGRGIDFSGDVRIPITGNVSLRSVANVSYLLKLQQINDDGTIPALRRNSRSVRLHVVLGRSEDACYLAEHLQLW